VDGRSVARRTLGPGDFQIAAPVEGEPGKRRIEVGFSRTQELPGADGRAVGARLQFLGFEPASAAVREGPADIIASPGMQLGEGWEPLETFRNETFRWVDNDAQLVVTPFKGEDANLLVTLEPGAPWCSRCSTPPAGRWTPSACSGGRRWNCCCP
jgi:hypothetical protein